MRPALWMLCAGVCAAGPVVADPLSDPLQLADRGPLAAIHGLPAPRSGSILAPGRSELRIAVEAANHFIHVQTDRETLYLDGESRRVELDWRAGIAEDWELRISAPMIDHAGGGLDSFIEDFHDFWGMPDAGRPAVARNQLTYRYTERGVERFALDDRQRGIGDVQIGAAWRLWSDARSAASLALTVKLPTGDAQKLTGSEAIATDLTFALSTDDFAGTGLRAFANAGVLKLEEGDVLTYRQRDVSAHSDIGLGWRVLDNLELKAQLQTHTALYDSELRALGGTTVQAILGGSLRLDPHWLLDIGVGEDVRVDTAPDVTMQIALRWLP